MVDVGRRKEMTKASARIAGNRVALGSLLPVDSDSSRILPTQGIVMNKLL